MSSKIEITKEQAERLAAADMSAFQELRLLLAAAAADHCEDSLHMVGPVVERQPNQCDGCRAGKPLVHGNLHMMVDASGYQDIMGCTAHLYEAPPELAELQATIAQLTAENERLKSESFESLYNDAIDEIERLKGGQGEPVALAIPDECPHLIMFDDTDRENLLFSGAVARSAALKTWEKISMSWNAHLFVRVERNSRDDRYPSATVSTSQPAPVSVLTEVRALLATTNYSASSDCHNAQVVGAACDLIDKAKELNQ